MHTIKLGIHENKIERIRLEYTTLVIVTRRLNSHVVTGRYRVASCRIFLLLDGFLLFAHVDYQAPL